MIYASGGTEGMGVGEGGVREWKIRCGWRDDLNLKQAVNIQCTLVISKHLQWVADSQKNVIR